MRELLKSFVYAGRGVAYCIRRERNMRIHLTFTVYMYSYLLLYDFFTVTRTQFAVIFVATAIVLMGECINTAVERSIDMVEKQYNKFAKVAKDSAAGAVLIAAIFAVAVGIAILWQPEAFSKMFLYYKENPEMIGALALSIVLSVVFIFKGIPEKGKERK